MAPGCAERSGPAPRAAEPRLTGALHAETAERASMQVTLWRPVRGATTDGLESARVRSEACALRVRGEPCALSL